MTNKEGNTPGPHAGTAADTVAYLAEQRGMALAENAHLRTVNAALVAALRMAVDRLVELDTTTEFHSPMILRTARAALAQAEGRTP